MLIEERKNANARLKIEENLIVYEKLNEYTKQIDLIYGRDWGNLQ